MKQTGCKQQRLSTGQLRCGAGGKAKGSRPQGQVLQTPSEAPQGRRRRQRGCLQRGAQPLGGAGLHWPCQEECSLQVSARTSAFRSIRPSPQTLCTCPSLAERWRFQSKRDSVRCACRRVSALLVSGFRGLGSFD